MLGRMVDSRKGHLTGKRAKEGSWGFSRCCWEAGGWERGDGGWSVGRERSQRVCGSPTRELKEQRLPEVPARTGGPPAGADLEYTWSYSTHSVLCPRRALAGRL